MRPSSHPIVAIDGPAGAGKSTVARLVAEQLGFLLVDTGAMYRAVALAAERAGLDVHDGAAIGRLAAQLLADHALRFARRAEGGIAVFLAGEEVTDAIRTAAMGMAASTVSAHPDVRAALLDLQRQAGAAGGVVLEGRDIGTVVFPDADLKFFLTARPEVRARRRFDELLARASRSRDPAVDPARGSSGEPPGNTTTTLAQIEAEVAQRDAQDAGRAVAPLRRAPNAIDVDSSERSIDETVHFIVGEVRRHQRDGRGDASAPPGSDAR